MTTETTHESIIDHDVIVFSKPNCVQCDQTKRLLTRGGISFHEVNIEDMSIRLTDQDYKTPYEFCTTVLEAQAAPVVMARVSAVSDNDPEPRYCDYTFWAGFRPDRIKTISH